MSLPLRSPLRRTLSRAAAMAGLDSDVLQTLVFRSWSIAAGGVMVLFIPAFLSEAEQGYYYTFASLLTLQIFFDLGMNQVILQLVSHEVAKGHQGGERFALIVRLVRRWYGVAALTFFLLVSAAGAGFLARAPGIAASQWLGPWVVLTLATAANLYLSSLLAVLEGSGNVASVARLRLHQSVLGHAAAWIALTAGAGLWAAVLVPLIAAGWSAQWLHASEAPLRSARAAACREDPAAPSWRRDIFPLQWRLAVSWISGYFIFQLLTPLVFARHGAVEAGRLGITLALFNAVLTAGLSWVNAKFPALSMHLARGERPQANALFQAVTARATAFCALLSGALLLALAAAEAFAPAVAHRFASLPVAACIAVVTLANTLVFAAAAYLRAHKEEPLLWTSVVSALAMLVAATAGSARGVLPMMALYMAVTLLVPLPWTLALWRRYYRRPA